MVYANVYLPAVLNVGALDSGAVCNWSRSDGVELLSHPLCERHLVDLLATRPRERLDDADPARALVAREILARLAERLDRFGRAIADDCGRDGLAQSLVWRAEDRDAVASVGVVCEPRRDASTPRACRSRSR